MACVRAMPNLKEMDLGNGSQEMSRYMFDYAVSREVVHSLMSGLGPAGSSKSPCRGGEEVEKQNDRTVRE